MQGSTGGILSFTAAQEAAVLPDTLSACAAASAAGSWGLWGGHPHILLLRLCYGRSRRRAEQSEASHVMRRSGSPALWVKGQAILSQAKPLQTLRGLLLTILSCKDGAVTPPTLSFDPHAAAPPPSNSAKVFKGLSGSAGAGGGSA